MIIRTSISAPRGAKQLHKQLVNRTGRRTRRARRSWKSTTTAAYVGAFLFIITIVAIGYQPPQQGAADSVANAAGPGSVDLVSGDSAPSVDQLIATRVAADIAERTELPIARNVANLSLSLAAESELAQTEANAIVKPQIIQPSAGSREIRTHKTVAGDTVGKLAERYNISSETIKWANDLTSDALEPGRTLQIPPTNGVLYTVKDGDTIKSIAERYGANERLLISYNDLELGGLRAGRKLILPDGDLPTTERPGYTPPQQRVVAHAPVSYGSGFGGRTWTIGYGTAPNRYAPGNCTAYAYNRRVQLGKPVGANWGHAGTWAAFAAAEGYKVNNSPSVGAIVQNVGGFGHVAIVEEILPNGDISISEMNAYVPGGGFNIVSGRIISSGSVSSYTYIH